MNKKHIYFATIFVAFSLLFSSCSDFLEMTPRDKKVVKTVEDHRDILASYMYLLKIVDRDQVKIMGVDPHAYPYFDVAKRLSLYTGESNMSTRWGDYYDKKNGKFYERAVRMQTWLVADNYIWAQYYQFLGPINILIKNIVTAEGTDENLRNYVLGEALVWRAFSYYKLLQYYSPYKDDKLGIPMYLDPSEDIGTAMPPRLSQTAVFANILGDCNRVLELLKKTPTNDWNLAYNEDFVHAMMASIYMWKALSGAAASNDWKMAKEHAEKAIGARTLASSTDDLKRMFNCVPKVLRATYQNSEFYMRLIDATGSGLLETRSAYDLDKYLVYSGFATGVAKDYYVKMYVDGDRRKEFYFQTKDGVTFNDKYNFSGFGGGDYDINTGVLMPFRLAEMYLIKAEAACRMGDVATAIETLRTFKLSRYNTPQNISGGADEVLKEILLERKREFYLENDIIWLDMKRTGASLERIVNGQTYVLEPNDFRYAFPIPIEELQKNRNIRQNQGWENIPQDS